MRYSPEGALHMKKRWIGLILAIIMVVSLSGILAATASEIPDMHVSESFLGVLKKMEGFYPQPYWDYGQYSIGYGSYCCELLDDPWTDPTYKYYMENPISEADATQLLIKELSGFERDVNKFIKKYGLTLKQHQYDALVSFSYNCGGNWMNELTGYFNTAVRTGDVSNALIYGMSLFSTAGGNYILIPRRMAEANMYINGEYKSYTEGNSYPATFKHVFLDGNGGTVKYTIHGYNAADPAGIVTDFKEIPTGKDANGKWFVYSFAGWFTKPVGGTQVTVLDGSLNNGTILYAQWKDPSGKIVALPKGELKQNLSVNVTANVNVRTGPGTFYPVNYTIQASAAAPKPITVTEVFYVGSTPWGKFEDGWLSLSYTNYNEVNSNPAPTASVTGISMAALPNKLQYVQKNEELNISGSILLTHYSDGSLKARTLAREHTTGFDNSTLGKKTVKVKYSGYTASFEVEIVKATVTFKNYDGKILSQQQYAYGEAVSAPGIPAKPEDHLGAYRFVRWDKEITACTGNAVYTAVFEMVPGSQKYTPGDINGDTTVTKDDAFHLLYSLVWGQTEYPITAPADFDNNGLVNKDDAFYLLYHLVWGEAEYPLTK